MNDSDMEKFYGIPLLTRDEKYVLGDLADSGKMDEMMEVAYRYAAIIRERKKADGLCKVKKCYVEWTAMVNFLEDKLTNQGLSQEETLELAAIKFKLRELKMRSQQS